MDAPNSHTPPIPVEARSLRGERGGGINSLAVQRYAPLPCSQGRGVKVILGRRIDVYRRNGVSVRVRSFDLDSKGQGKPQRHQSVWRFRASTNGVLRQIGQRRLV